MVDLDGVVFFLFFRLPLSFTHIPDTYAFVFVCVPRMCVCGEDVCVARRCVCVCGEHACVAKGGACVGGGVVGE